MAITKDAEKLVSQVENGEGAKYGRDARKFAVDSWKIHTGEWPAPQGLERPLRQAGQDRKGQAQDHQGES